MGHKLLGFAALAALLGCSGKSGIDGGGGGTATGGGVATGGGAATGGGSVGGGTGTGGGTQDAGLPFAEYCPQLAQHICAHEQQCTYLDPAQAPDCIAAVERECQLGADEVNDGRYAYDPASVPPCFAAIDTFGCTERLISPYGLVFWPQQCWAVFGTAVATAGHACASDYDCDAGYCDDDNGSCPVCKPFIPINGPCFQHGCDPRVAYCEQLSMVCTPVMTPGQGPCTDSPRSCAPGSWCADSVDGGPRLCQSIKADGTPCSNGGECLSYFCNGNRYGVDAGPSVCGLDPVGAGCGLNQDCTSGLCVSSVCVASQPNQPVGSPCGLDEHCAPSLYCASNPDGGRNSLCAQRKDAGEPCNYDSCLPGLVCSQSIFVCVPVGHAGQPCGALDAGGWADNAECTELLWCEADGGAGTCVPWLGLNDSCNESTSICSAGDCVNDADAGRICGQLPTRIGEVCTSNYDCPSRRCLQDDGGYLDAFHASGTCANFCL